MFCPLQVLEAAAAGSPLAQLGRALDATLEYANRHPDLCRLYFQQVLLDDKEFVRRRAALHRGLVGDLEGTIRQAIAAGELPDQDPWLAAQTVFGAVEAVVRQLLDGTAGMSSHQAGDQLRGFIISGLRLRPRPGRHSDRAVSGFAPR